MPQTIISNVVRTNILRKANIFFIVLQIYTKFPIYKQHLSPKNVP